MRRLGISGAARLNPCETRSLRDYTPARLDPVFSSDFQALLWTLIDTDTALNAFVCVNFPGPVCTVDCDRSIRAALCAESTVDAGISNFRIVIDFSTRFRSGNDQVFGISDCHMVVFCQTNRSCITEIFTGLTESAGSHVEAAGNVFSISIFADRHIDGNGRRRADADTESAVCTFVRVVA